MTYECFEVHIEDNIAHLILSRPEKRNAMNRAFWQELPQIVQDIDAQSKARVIVLSAQGPVFSAGIDVSILSTDVTSVGDKNDPQYGADFFTNVRRLQSSFSALENCRLPVIAAIQGGCIGGGVDLVTACDMRFGTENSFISIFEVKVGMTADVGTFPRILNLMPEGIVRELAYTGRHMMAKECLSHGLFNGVYADTSAMMEAVITVAKEIAANPPLAVYGCKQVINYSRDHSTQSALDQVAMWNMSMLVPSEIQEAMSARAEKRSPVFTDLPKMKP